MDNANNANPLTCTSCAAQGTEHYYYTCKKSGVRKPFGKCTKCHNQGHKSNYVKKGTGWSKVPEEQKKRIIELLKDRRNKVKDIAEEEGINYANLNRWIKSGKVTL